MTLLHLFIQLSGQCLLDGLFQNESITFPIEVREITKCPLTFFESKPALVPLLVRKVMKDPFTRQLSDRTEVKDAMIQLQLYFPSLAKGEFGFYWPGAFDLYTCHRAHDLPIPREVYILSVT